MDECIRAFAAAVAAEEPKRDQEHEDSAGYFSHRRRIAARWNMIGAVLSHAGEKEKALKAYTNALSVQPRFPRALANRALALMDAEKPAEAARDCLEALRMLPSSFQTPVWETIAQACLKLGEPDEELVEALKSRNLDALERGRLKGIPRNDPHQELDDEGLAKASFDVKSQLRELGLLEQAEQVLSGEKPLESEP